MTLQQYAGVLRARWKLLAAGLVLGILGAMLFVFLNPPSYTARMTLYVYAQTGTTADSAYQGTLTSEKRVSSYTALLTDDRVTSDVVTRLALPISADDLAKDISASNATDSVLIDLTVSQPTPEGAAAVCNAVAASFVSVVNDLERPTVPNVPQQVAVRSVKPAVPPTAPSNVGTPATLVVGAILGLALGAVAALVLHATDTTVRDLKALKTLTGVPNLGSFGQEPDTGDRPLIHADPVPSQRAEDFKQLRTNLQFLDVDRPRQVVLFTSSVAGEGKSTTVTNLAIAMAAAGGRVVVVDADLRRPRVAGLFGLDGDVGLTSVLSNKIGLDQAVQTWTPGRVDVLTTGPVPPNPSELLGSHHMRMVLTELSRRYDTVLVDSPPLLPVTDAAVLSPSTDAVILVCRFRSTSAGQVQLARDALATVAAPLAGTVVTMVPRTDRQVYGTSEPYVSALPVPAAAAPAPRPTPTAPRPSPTATGPRPTSRVSGGVRPGPAPARHSPRSGVR